jgi:RNA polymerase sigma-70 factor (ECF subfamily)
MSIKPELPEATLEPADFLGYLEPYKNRLYRAIYMIVRNAEDAQDLLQDTIVRAYQNLSRYNPSKPLYPWLLTIGRNLARNFLRKKESQNLGFPEGVEFPTAGHGPEDLLIQNETSKTIMDCLALLKSEQREILELKHFQECSYEEIAQILDIPIGTVMSRLYYSRKKLAELLQNHTQGGAL